MSNKKTNSETTCDSCEPNFDLLIIGAGSAGFSAAIRASEIGAKVGLIEGGVIGGTCVNEGCVPSKTLIRAAEIRHRSTHHSFRGVETLQGNLSWSDIRAQKDELVEALRQAKYRDVLKSYPGIKYIEGKARILQSNEVELSHGAKLKAEKLLITTGARPWVPPIQGLNDIGFLDSTSAMNLDSLPKSMIILGGSAVGLELAQMFSRLGVRITVIEVASRIVPLEDADIGDALTKYLEEEEITIHTGVKILSVKRNSRGYQVVTENNNTPQTIDADQLLVATGRRPNTEDLGLSEIRVEVGSKGHILTNEYLQTDNPNIYAAGDCTTEAAFVYVAAYSGNLAADNALQGHNRKFDISVLPKVTFTDPQVASVGLTEEQAKAKGINAISAKLNFDHVPRALAARDTRGFIKLVADKDTGKLLGAHILAPEGGELIEIPTLAMKFGIGVKDLATTFFPYLTQTEAIKLCAQTFNKDVSKLSCCA
ncbi:MAG: mercury(II) reductase [Deltaproteobacteria bacterium]|nr:mercury(II) reductase [Deltaproteobacteria bacterium]